MIYGENLTDPGMDSNGAGKSGLLEGITLAITGATCRDVTKERFITRGENTAFVELSLENKITTVQKLVIKRWIDLKKSAKVEIWENDKLNKEITSVNEANQRIYELIGISREDLLHFFIIGQGTNYSFLSCSDTEQKEIISRLTNLDLLNEKIEQIKLIIKEKNVVKEELRNSVQKFENFITLVEEDIIEEKKNGKAKIQSKIDLIEEASNSLDEEIKGFNQKILTLEKQLKVNEDNLSKKKTESPNSDDLNESIESIKKEIRTFNKNKSDYEDLIDDLNRHLKGKTSCPKCKFEWIKSDEFKVEEIPVLIESFESKIAKIDLKILKRNKDLKQLTIKLQSHDEFSKQIAKIEKEISDNEFEIKRLKRKIILADDEKVNNNDKIKKLKDELKENKKIEALKEKIKEYQKSLNEENAKLVRIENEIAKYDFWGHHFSKKGFLTYLTNQSIKTIEGVTNYYLKNFNTDLQLNIDGFTILKNGEMREKININILRGGVDVGSFEGYSGGEKGRIKLANIVGLQTLMNSSAESGGLNFLGLDEVFEGLDSTGQKEVLNILENIHVTTMVVSHMNNSIGAENEIHIKKIDGVSNIYAK